MSYTNTRWKIAGQIPRLQKTLHVTNSDGGTKGKTLAIKDAIKDPGENPRGGRGQFKKLENYSPISVSLPSIVASIL